VRITYSFSAPCAPEAIFALLLDPEEQKRWMPELLANEPISPGPTRPGLRFRLRVREDAQAVEYLGEVTAFDPPRRLAARFWGGSFPRGVVMHADYRLTPEAGGTRLDYCCESGAGVFAWLMMWLFQGSARAKVRRHMEALRALASPEAA
jgi:uncharacterized protein YndB with AHSA1/START domain